MDSSKAGNSKTTNGNAQPGFTPGPIVTKRGELVCNILEDGQRALTVSYRADQPTAFRNRLALTCAAPDLYAALDRLVRSFDANSDLHNPDNWQAARLALSRARGECKGGA